MTAIAPPQTVNTVANFVNNLIGIAMTGGEDAVEAYVISLDPELFAIPVVGPVIRALLDELVDEVGTPLYENIAKFTSQIVMLAEAGIENSTLKNAANNLAAAEASGDANAIAQNTQSVITAWGNIIHSDGSATNANSAPAAP